MVPIVVAIVRSGITVITSIRSTVKVVVAAVAVLVVDVVSLGFWRYPEGAF
jgi:hypothetical protein